MKPIEKAGVYDIDIDDYHGDPNLCDGPSISSSGLRTLLSECPAKFWALSPLNPNRFPDESTKALDVGRAAHCLTLGEPEFARHFVVSPHDRHNANPGKQWYDQWKIEVAAGREKRALLKPDEFKEVQTLSAVQKRSAQCMRAFEDGAPEKSLIWRDKATGIWLRSRPDFLPHSPAKRFTTEYKTCLSIEPNKLSNDVFKYGYHIQVAMIVDGIREVLGVDPIGVALVCQEKEPPYLVELRLFTPEQIEDGRQMYHHALGLFAACLKADHWPGYTDEPTYFTTPYSHAMKMEAISNEQFRHSTTPDRKSLAVANTFNAG